MRKESVQKFDLETAFKALNEVEIPVVKGIRPNREDLQEKFTRKLVTDVLVEDYYDVGDTEELEKAKKDREAEIAKAKLARIEKIVDLDAETEDDILPSYVGKFIIQCPQCMTLFYKNEEDIEKSDENPDVVNINEPCQHCGNSSGYTLIGKVDTVGEDEAAQYDVEDFDENELNLDFEDEEESTKEAEEPTEDAEEHAEETEESTEEAAADKDEDKELDLEPVDAEETEEKKEVEESLTEDVDKDLDDKLKEHNEYIEYLKNMIKQEEEALTKADNEFVKEATQRRLDALKADLEKALPDELKAEVEVNSDLPTPEEANMEAAAENTAPEEEKEKKESLTEDAHQNVSTDKPHRKYSATELMIKELKNIEPFNKLSTRTIQRILLPYYIENMGRDDLSAQALVDFFEYEGFAPYVLDHFMTMDPLARKELLKADKKFMQIFNDYATAYNFFPNKDETIEPGESEFDYAFNIMFDIDSNGLVPDTDINRNTIKSLGKMYAEGQFDKSLIVENLTEDTAVDVLFDSEEFKTPISDAEIDKIRAKYEGLEEDVAPGVETEIAINNIVDTWESIEDFDDEAFNKLTENYLTNVYSNVKSFKTTQCDLKDGKLVVEGIITFNSGKTKPTTFEYEAKINADKQVILEGLNADFASEKAFILSCKVDTNNRLVVESLSYKYTVNDTLVEGLLK